jgi:hypothetical protein
MVMKRVIDDINSVLDTMEPSIRAISEAEFSAKPRLDKWSKKEVIGHLIDSAQNNLRRFISARTEDRPKIIYEQDFWVTANGYQSATQDDVITLWRLLNERICAVLAAMPPSSYGTLCDTGHGESQYKSLEWLATDYVRHMKHHMNQVIAGSYNIVYP